jgi:hypothetical protein
MLVRAALLLAFVLTTLGETVSPPAPHTTAASSEPLFGLTPKRILRERTAPLSHILRPAENFKALTLGLTAGLTLDVEFFPGSVHSLRINSTKVHTGSRSVASGTIEGIEGSYFILARNEGQISGRFSFSDGRTYLMRSTEDRIAHVAEINSRARLSCGNKSLEGDARSAIAPPALASVLSARKDSFGALQPADRAEPARIDVLFIYTPSVLSAARSVATLNAQLDMLIETANLCFSNSEINARVNLVGAQPTATEGYGSQLDDLRGLVEPEDGVFDEAHPLRDKYQADLVCLLVTDDDAGGVSELIFRASPGYAPFAFFACEYQQSLIDFTFAHELGHDLGAKHDHSNDTVSPSPEFPAGYGYVFTANDVTNQTVMVQNDFAHGIPYFSNPDVLYMGVPTGIPLGQANPANNAEVLNRTAWIVESYRTATNSLADGLDTLSVPWRTGTEHPWFFQTSVTHDGTDAIESSNLASGEQSWIEARIFGPGSIDYWLKLQSAGTDALDFSIDGVLQHSFSATGGWQHPSLPVTDGVHFVRWTYRKKSSLHAGEGAWLDQLNPLIPPVLVSRETVPQHPIIMTNDYLRVNTESLLRYRVVLEGGAPATYQWLQDGQPLKGRTNATLLFPSLHPTNGGTYRLQVITPGGSAVPFISELQVPDSPPFDWLKTASSSNAIGRSIALDAQSNAFVCGAFRDSISFGSTNLSVGDSNHLEHGFIAKFNQSGLLLWARQITAIGGNDVASSIRTDSSGNAFVSGIFRSSITVGTTTLLSAGEADIYLAKFDPAGKLLWVRQAGGAGNDSAGVAVDAVGNAYLPGTFNGTAKFGSLSVTSAGGTDAFLAKYSPGGTPLWVIRGGGTNDDSGAAAVADDAGFIYFAGSAARAVKFESTQFTGSSDVDSFVAKYTTGGGKLVWVKHHGPGQGSKATTVSLTVDPTGDLLVAGEFGQSDSSIVRGFVDFWDSGNGEYLGGLTMGAHGVLRARSVRADEQGNFFVSGVIKGTCVVGSTGLTTHGSRFDNWDGFVAKYTYSGNAIWIKTFGGANYDFASSMSVNSGGEVFLTGTYAGDALFTPFSASGGEDFWLAKIGVTTGPNLNAINTDGSIRLTWPITAGDLSLKSIPALSRTNVWTELTYELHPGNTNSVEVPLSGRSRFFQLQ